MPQFEGGAFAAVLDKGTLDAIVCGVSAEQDAHSMVAECYRSGCRQGPVTRRPWLGPAFCQCSANDGMLFGCHQWQCRRHAARMPWVMCYTFCWAKGMCSWSG